MNGEVCDSASGFNFHLHRLTRAFAALSQPRGESLGVALGLDAKACLDAAIGDGKHVIEFGGIGEVAHAEAIKPVERARLAFAGDDDFNAEFLRVHSASITSRRNRPGERRRVSSRENSMETREDRASVLIHRQRIAAARLASR